MLLDKSAKRHNGFKSPDPLKLRKPFYHQPPYTLVTKLMPHLPQTTESTLPLVSQLSLSYVLSSLSLGMLMPDQNDLSIYNKWQKSEKYRYAKHIKKCAHSLIKLKIITISVTFQKHQQQREECLPTLYASK